MLYTADPTFLVQGHLRTDLPVRYEALIDPKLVQERSLFVAGVYTSIFYLCLLRPTRGGYQVSFRTPRNPETWIGPAELHVGQQRVGVMNLERFRP